MFEAGSNSFTLSPSKRIKTTSATGIISKQGRGGGTFEEKSNEELYYFAHEVLADLIITTDLAFNLLNYVKKEKN